MGKPTGAIFYATLLAIAPNIVCAQGNTVELSKNPFRKPELVKIKPVVAKASKKRYKKRVVIPNFNLTATLVSANAPMALVNDKLLSPEHQVDGMRLVKVTEEQAVIRYKGKNYTLKMLHPKSGQTRDLKRNLLQ